MHDVFNLNVPLLAQPSLATVRDQHAYNSESKPGLAKSIKTGRFEYWIMKVVEINIDQTPGFSKIKELLALEDLQEGDTLKFYKSNSESNDFLRLAILLIAIYAIGMLQKKHVSIGEAIIKDALDGKEPDTIEKEIEAEYGIKISVEDSTLSPQTGKRKSGGLEGRMALPDDFNDPIEDLKQ
jgi:hypothetical protein